MPAKPIKTCSPFTLTGSSLLTSMDTKTIGLDAGVTEITGGPELGFMSGRKRWKRCSSCVGVSSRKVKLQMFSEMMFFFVG